jgi:D-glycero-D-manno-heptose 1,7-bisphosphate phosphatase
MNFLVRAIFLDRDGVVNRKAPEGSYVASIGEFEVLPGSLEAIAKLCGDGWQVFLVTNQRGIARGMVSENAVEQIHRWLLEQVRNAGGEIMQVYVCPHDYSDLCDCRKPKPGMLLRAAREHSLDLAHSWMVGDSIWDMQAGRAVGCKTAYLGEGRCEMADIEAPSLQFFVEQLQQQDRPYPKADGIKSQHSKNR